MKLRDPFVRLPMQFDAERLADEIAVFAEDAWKRKALQAPDEYELSLVAVHGDPGSEATSGPMRPTAYLARCPCLMQVLASMDAVWGRTRLVKSKDRLGIERRADTSYYSVTHASMHVPIATHSGVRFLCDGAEIHMGAGECWVVDTWRDQRIVVDQSGERVHLVADTVGSDTFRTLLNKGCSPHRVSPDWAPEIVSPSPQPVDLRFESVNVPVVMTPWELREHVGLLLAETRPHPKFGVARDALNQFLASWHVLWTHYGLDMRGRGLYRNALGNLEGFMEREASELRLGNRAAFLSALRSLVLEKALSGDGRVQ